MRTRSQSGGRQPHSVRTLSEVRARYRSLQCGWDGAHPVPDGADSCSCGTVTIVRVTIDITVPEL